MNIKKCDKCGTQIEQYENSCTLLPSYNQQELPRMIELEELDFCNTCYKNILSTIFSVLGWEYTHACQKCGNIKFAETTMGLKCSHCGEFYS